MPQIFTASADTRLRAVALMLVPFVLICGLSVGGFMDSSYDNLAGWVANQPVPFSHKHHAGELGIDCRYCHTGVETSPQAGLPATHICMTCHSQLYTDAPMLAPVRASLANGTPLKWRRIARLPDYVYFNHSIHVSRGVPCEECHGRIDQMPLTTQAHGFTMGWCLDCHRNPGPHLRPPDQVTRMDWSAWDRHAEQHAGFAAQAMKAHHIEPDKLDDCALCHR